MRLRGAMRRRSRPGARCRTPCAPSARCLGRSNMLAYLAMMAPRLVELRRVLKPTGSIYLHCDPTASHYLKLLMDAVFGPENFLSEIVWRRTGTHDKARGGLRPDPSTSSCSTTKSGTYAWTGAEAPVHAWPRGERTSSRMRRDARTNYYGNVLTGSGTRNGESGKPWRDFDPRRRVATGPCRERSSRTSTRTCRGSVSMPSSIVFWNSGISP